MYNTDYMTERTLRSVDLEQRRLVREDFGHLQHVANLSEQSKVRVGEALKAAIAHVEKKHDLQYGMREHHIDEALHFLDTHYEGRHDLKSKEREIVEKSFNSHFKVKETPPEAANDDEHRKAA